MSLDNVGLFSGDSYSIDGQTSSQQKRKREDDTIESPPKRLKRGEEKVSEKIDIIVQDVLVQIIKQTGFAFSLKLICKSFSCAYQYSLKNFLFASYQESPLLKERADRLEKRNPTLSSLQKAQALYQEILKTIHKTPGGENGAISELISVAPGPLACLELLESRLDDLNLIILFKRIGKLQGFEKARLFCEEIQAKESACQALEMRNWMKIHSTSFANWMHLQLRKQCLTKLPKEITLFTDLQWLYLSNNPLTALPKEIEQMTKLTQLNLDKNQLVELPEEIGKLTRLEQLYLMDNPFITDLSPEELDKLRQRLKQQLTQLQQLYFTLDDVPVFTLDS